MLFKNFMKTSKINLIQVIPIFKTPNKSRNNSRNSSSRRKNNNNNKIKYRKNNCKKKTIMLKIREK